MRRPTVPSAGALAANILSPCCMRAGMYLGAKIAILGSNGAGKSTLMRMLAGDSLGASCMA